MKTAQFTAKSKKQRGLEVSECRRTKWKEKRKRDKKRKAKTITEIIFEFLFVSLFSFYCAFARIETNYIFMLFNYNYIKQFNDRDISAENRERNVRMICSLWVVWMLVPPIYIDILNGDSFQKA